jgi:hypothetical protein
MSDQPIKDEQPAADEQVEYVKPQIEVLGDLRDLTEGALTATTDVGVSGSR